MPPFHRDVFCLLGLPFDLLDLDGAKHTLIRAIEKGEQCFISTPNVNFLIASTQKEGFRSSVLRSDLSLIDGMPLVLIARLIGIPVKERVAGSDLFDSLRTGTKKIKVFFFGGPPGAADAACKALAAEDGNIVPVGSICPGFGNVSEMSEQSYIDAINRSCADFLVVALGAEKGQAWIEHNLSVLSPPAVSHLGAVVNFVAGSVQRAPLGVRKLGLEWAWRIYCEPTLWKRYATDGAKTITLLLTRVVPSLIVLPLLRAGASKRLTTWEEVNPDEKNSVVHFTGSLTRDSVDTIYAALAPQPESTSPVLMDFSKVDFIDNYALGALLIVKGQLSKQQRSMHILKPSKKTRLCLWLNACTYLLARH